MITAEENSLRGISRRSFARLTVLGGSAAFAGAALMGSENERPSVAPSAADERYWDSIRDQFSLDNDLAIMNAANLCPSPRVVREALESATRDIDRDPSFNNRAKMSEARESTRKLLAEFLRVAPDEIVITRNTSESNNLVSSGLDLKSGDEVLIYSDNHPSNHQAWREKAKRFGYSVRIVEQVNPHPGAEYYLEAFTRAVSPKTRVLAFTHLTNTAGDLLPAKQICRMARDRGILTVIDGAQSFGLLDVDLGEIQPDFYTGSAHKWPCGARETGVLYIRRDAQARIAPSTISAYPGAVGISKSFEGFGQRDDAAVVAFGEALRFQFKIGRKQIEGRARELAQALIQGLQKIDGVRLWTHPSPERSAAVVTFMPGNLNVSRLSEALYTTDRIAGAARGGADRPGLRFSPHLYNTHREVERILAAVRKYISTGV